jgi:hypothetical protein
LIVNDRKVTPTRSQNIFMIETHQISHQNWTGILSSVNTFPNTPKYELVHCPDDITFLIRNDHYLNDGWRGWRFRSCL